MFKFYISTTIFYNFYRATTIKKQPNIMTRPAMPIFNIYPKPQKNF